MIFPRVNGIIKDLVLGNDGYVTSVTVRTANRTTNRPIARLYPLEVSVDECPSNLNIKESAQPEPTSNTEIPQQMPGGL